MPKVSNEICRFVDVLKTDGDASAAADFLDTCSAALMVFDRIARR
jgi:hypothetical protein